MANGMPVSAISDGNANLDWRAWLEALQDEVAAVAGGSAGGGIWVNVQSDHNAAGDGIADDTAEIQAAISAVRAAGGGVVYFPKGRYKITSQLTLDNTGDTGRFSNRVIFVGGMICWGLGRSAWASTEVRHHDQMVAFLATRLPQLAEAGDLEKPKDLP